MLVLPARYISAALGTTTGYQVYTIYSSSYSYYSFLSKSVKKEAVVLSA